MILFCNATSFHSGYHCLSPNLLPVAYFGEGKEVQEIEISRMTYIFCFIQGLIYEYLKGVYSGPLMVQKG